MTVNRKWELYKEYLENWVRDILIIRNEYLRPYSFSEFCEVCEESEVF